MAITIFLDRTGRDPLRTYFRGVFHPRVHCDTLQREHRIVVTGPTTLAALLNSLQMGFRTLVIEKRSSEVWELLGMVKTEFGKFGEVLSKTKKKLQEASNTIGMAEVRSRAIERRLKKVQEVPLADDALLVEEEEQEDM